MHDDNSTNSSHHNENTCFYVTESIHGGNNNNNNNTNLMSVNTFETSTPMGAVNNGNYYCDTRSINVSFDDRKYPKQLHSYGHSSPTEQQVCMEFQNAAMSYTNNNNNNNISSNNNNNISINNNNIDGNYKGHKRKAADIFAMEQHHHHSEPFSTYMHHNDYYANEDHVGTNIEVHPPTNNSPIMNDYCGGVLPQHQNHYVTYFNGDSGNDLAQLTNNYQMPIANTN